MDGWITPRQAFQAVHGEMTTSYFTLMANNLQTLQRWTQLSACMSMIDYTTCLADVYSSAGAGGLLVLGRPRPHLQLARAISSEKQPRWSLGEFDGLHFCFGGERAHLLLRWQVQQADAVALVEGAKQNRCLSRTMHAKEGA